MPREDGDDDPQKAGENVANPVCMKRGGDPLD
jgi:hypothetical protein